MPPRHTQNLQDDRYFPVRVRVAVPPGGFGAQLNIMDAWLNDCAGREGWARHGASLPGLDAVAFYFRDIGTARAFLDRFACGLAIPAEARPARRDPYGGGGFAW